MKKYFKLLLLSILSLTMYSCSKTDEHDFYTLQNWDLLMTGYTESWDMELKDNTNYNLGIIEFHSKVLSDSKNSETYHDELISNLVKKISPNCNVNIIVLSEDATDYSINEAIEKLYNEGCHIINLSFGQSEPFELSTSILEKINDETLVIVCAAGNQAKGILYPAADKNTVSVLAKDINGGIPKIDIDTETKASFSAPGCHIYVNDDYFSGSSLSTVYVSIAFLALYSENAVPTIDLIEIAKGKAVNSSSPNDYGIIQL